MRQRNNKLSVVFDLPDDDITAERVAEFVADALEAWGGGFHPNDELFNSLSIKRVTVGNQTFENPKPKEF